MPNNPLPPVWIYWQGPRPALVNLCIRTILRHNPSARVIGPGDVARMPSRHDVPSGADVLRLTRHRTPPFRSNLLRVWLIWRFGGVWVDADSVCTQPLELVPLAVEHDLVAVENPGFTARETPIGGRHDSPCFAATFERYAHVFKTWRHRTPLDRLLRAHIVAPDDPARITTLPSHLYYPFLYRQIPTMMLCRGRGLDPRAAALWPINHVVYHRLRGWTEHRVLNSPLFVSQCLRHALDGT